MGFGEREFRVVLHDDKRRPRGRGSQRAQGRVVLIYQRIGWVQDHDAVRVARQQHGRRCLNHLRTPDVSVESNA